MTSNSSILKSQVSVRSNSPDQGSGCSRRQGANRPLENPTQNPTAGDFEDIDLDCLDISHRVIEMLFDPNRPWEGFVPDPQYTPVTNDCPGGAQDHNTPPTDSANDAEMASDATGGTGGQVSGEPPSEEPSPDELSPEEPLASPKEAAAGS